MKFIGFNFTKINVEKFSNKPDKLKINTKIDISKINFVKADFIENNELAKIDFNYIVDYEPNFAKIFISGEIFISDKVEIIKDFVKKWEKNQQIVEEHKIFVYNIILRKSGLKALQLEDEMNLPLHMPFPSIKKEKK